MTYQAEWHPVHNSFMASWLHITLQHSLMPTCCTCRDGPDRRDFGPGPGAWVWSIVSDGVPDGHITVQGDSAQVHDGGGGKKNIQVDPHGTEWCREGPGVTWRGETHSENQTEGIQLKTKGLETLAFLCCILMSPVSSFNGLRPLSWSEWFHWKAWVWWLMRLFCWHDDEKQFKFYNIVVCLSVYQLVCLPSILKSKFSSVSAIELTHSAVGSQAENDHPPFTRMKL